MLKAASRYPSQDSSGPKGSILRGRLDIAGKKTRRMLAHREAFSPLPKAKSARKVSPFCHIDQQIISETEGEPSQIRRDVKAIRAIRRRKFYFRKLPFLHILQILN
jgi:hypothetical protein